MPSPGGVRPLPLSLEPPLPRLVLRPPPPRPMGGDGGGDAGGCSTWGGGKERARGASSSEGEAAGAVQTPSIQDQREQIPCTKARRNCQIRLVPRPECPKASSMSIAKWSAASVLGATGGEGGGVLYPNEYHLNRGVRRFARSTCPRLAGVVTSARVRSCVTVRWRPGGR